MHVLEADHYREEEANLMLDPIIQQMAAEIPKKLIKNGKVKLDSWDFIKSSLDEYHERGGKNAKSIGGPARAITALLED